MTRDDYCRWGARAVALRGEKLKHAKLTADSVRAIRSNVAGKTAKQQAEEFGVHYRTIEKVRSLETWSHIK